MAVSVVCWTAQPVLETEWLGRTGLVPEMAGEQELNFSSSERERLVQYPVEIPAPVFSPRKDPET